MAIKKNGRGVQYAKGRISRGKVDYDSKWEFSAEDDSALLGENADLNRYGENFLAVDDDARESSKARFSLPHGKGGVVFRSALTAAKKQAKKDGNDSVMDAADALLKIVNGKAENARRCMLLADGDDRVGVILSDAICPITLEGNTDEGWTQLCRTGKWKGHPVAGAFEVTDDDLAVIKVNFDRLANEMMVDRGHESAWNMGAEAYGWCSEMEIRGDKLYGFVRWTRKAADMIRNEELRFISPIIVFSTIDPESGEDIGYSMFTAALTNTPFIDGMDPVKVGQQLAAASRRLIGDNSAAPSAENANQPQAQMPDRGAQQEDEMDKKAICAELNISENSTDIEIVKAINAYRADSAKAVEAVRVAGELRADNEAKIAELAQTKEKFAALETANEARVKAEAEALVERYCAAGRIAPASKAQAVALARSDRATFDTLYGKVDEPRPAVAPMAQPGPDSQPNAQLQTQLTPDEVATCAAAGISQDAFAKEKARMAGLPRDARVQPGIPGSNISTVEK